MLKTASTKRNKKYQNKLTALIRGLNASGVGDKLKASPSRQPNLQTHKDAVKHNYAVCGKDAHMVKSKLDVRKDDSSVESVGQQVNAFNSLEYRSSKMSESNKVYLTCEATSPKHKY